MNQAFEYVLVPVFDLTQLETDPFSGPVATLRIGYGAVIPGGSTKAGGSETDSNIFFAK